eukprot:1337650-Rhodomonas_salina.1
MECTPCPHRRTRRDRESQRKPEGQRATKRCGLVVAVFSTQANGSPKVGSRIKNTRHDHTCCEG